MQDESQQNLYQLYQDELNYVRKAGHDFSKKYPKAASFLELGNIGSYDPHVERLIEAFAFLTARIQYNIDEQFPQIVSSLLNVIYPQFANPIPAMAIAHFKVDTELCDSPNGFVIEPGTMISSQPHDNLECEFQTTSPDTLWPLEITGINFDHPEVYTYFMDRSDVLSILSISLVCQTGTIKSLNLSKIRFYINLADYQAHQLYELIFSRTTEIVLLDDDNKKVMTLSSDQIKPVGFDMNENVLPCPGHIYKIYTAITEYFLFERKYMFFEIEIPDVRPFSKKMTIQIAQSQRNENIRLNKSSLLLGCLPIINLFNRKSEPFRLDQKQHSYLLLPDKYNDHHVEIHSINQLYSFSADGVTTSLDPIYTSSYLIDDSAANCYWSLSRKSATEAGKVGTDIYVSLLDKELNPNVPLGDIIYADCLCTNRYLTNQVAENELFTTITSLPVESIRCITKPTQKIQPSLTAKAQWRMLSALSYNHLYLLNKPGAIDLLRDILNTISFTESDSVVKEILGIKETELKPIIKRIGYDAWRGYCQGTRVALTFDRSYYSNNTPFLFSMVLERFFAHLTSVNSFTQLVIKDIDQKGIWKTWPPRTGEQQLI